MEDVSSLINELNEIKNSRVNQMKRYSPDNPFYTVHSAEAVLVTEIIELVKNHVEEEKHGKERI